MLKFLQRSTPQKSPGLPLRVEESIQLAYPILEQLITFVKKKKITFLKISDSCPLSSPPIYSQWNYCQAHDTVQLSEGSHHPLSPGFRKPLHRLLSGKCIACRLADSFVDNRNQKQIIPYLATKEKGGPWRKGQCRGREWYTTVWLVRHRNLNILHRHR